MRFKIGKLQLNSFIQHDRSAAHKQCGKDHKERDRIIKGGGKIMHSVMLVLVHCAVYFLF